MIDLWVRPDTHIIALLPSVSKQSGQGQCGYSRLELPDPCIRVTYFS
jgi:hypothetical protein